MNYRSSKKYNTLDDYSKSVIDSIAKKLQEMIFSDKTSLADIPEMEKLVETWVSYGMDKPENWIYEIRSCIQKNELNKRFSTPKIIQEIIESLQLKPHPIDGKYELAADNHKQFVIWLVNNNYNEYLTQDNYFEFIHCRLDAETIKRYYREARNEKND